jgi:hypothetical protein
MFIEKEKKRKKKEFAEDESDDKVNMSVATFGPTGNAIVT